MPEVPDQLDDLLERCLAARASGESLASSLAGLTPRDRRELEPLLLMADAFRQAPRLGLSAATSASNERRLLARSAELRWAARSASSTKARQGFLHDMLAPLRLFASLRLSFVPAATIFLLAASVVLLGGAGAMVSNARPDDTLYNLKLSWEQAQLMVANNDAQRARVFVEIAQNRVKEIELLAQEQQPIPEDLLLQVKLYVNQAIALTAAAQGREAIPLLRQISELLSYERVLLSRFLETLPLPDRATVELVIQSIEESQQSVRQTLQERVDEYVPGPTSTIPSAERIQADFKRAASGAGLSAGARPAGETAAATDAGTPDAAPGPAAGDDSAPADEATAMTDETSKSEVEPPTPDPLPVAAPPAQPARAGFAAPPLDPAPTPVGARPGGSAEAASGGQSASPSGAQGPGSSSGQGPSQGQGGGQGQGQGGGQEQGGQGQGQGGGQEQGGQGQGQGGGQGSNQGSENNQGGSGGQGGGNSGGSDSDQDHGNSDGNQGGGNDDGGKGGKR